MGTSCTEAEAAGVAVVSRIEVFPLPGPIPIIGAKNVKSKYIVLQIIIHPLKNSTNQNVSE